MQVEWYGQSAFRLAAPEATVFVDPFDVSAFASRKLEFAYPPIDGVEAGLVLVTHEHPDHNGVHVIGGDPALLRATAGTHQSPIGEVVAVAAEHDPVAGTQRGPSTILRFELDGLAVCHFGDFGQSSLRDEQAAALGTVGLLFLPVGGGPTIGAAQAAEIVERLSPRWVVPMHYRTPRVDFLEPADAFLELMPNVHLLDGPVFDTAELPLAVGPLAVVPSSP
jgi:L-ascorbate metabolism protein UlaG (beta-lactamase superfamily)